MQEVTVERLTNKRDFRRGIPEILTLLREYPWWHEEIPMTIDFQRMDEDFIRRLAKRIERPATVWIISKDPNGQLLMHRLAEAATTFDLLRQVDPRELKKVARIIFLEPVCDGVLGEDLVGINIKVWKQKRPNQLAKELEKLANAERRRMAKFFKVKL